MGVGEFGLFVTPFDGRVERLLGRRCERRQLPIGTVAVECTAPWPRRRVGVECGEAPESTAARPDGAFDLPARHQGAAELLDIEGLATAPVVARVGGVEVVVEQI